jgi:hypothetical protein
VEILKHGQKVFYTFFDYSYFIGDSSFRPQNWRKLGEYPKDFNQACSSIVLESLGKGIFYYPDGAKIEGRFTKDGLPIGKSIYTSSDSTTKEVEFVAKVCQFEYKPLDSSPHELKYTLRSVGILNNSGGFYQVVVIFYSFHRFEGYTSNLDEIHGYGKLYTPDGRLLYSGDFRNNRLEGPGIFYDISGRPFGEMYSNNTVQNGLGLFIDLYSGWKEALVGKDIKDKSYKTYYENGLLQYDID